MKRAPTKASKNVGKSPLPKTTIKLDNIIIAKQ